MTNLRHRVIGFVFGDSWYGNVCLAPPGLDAGGLLWALFIDATQIRGRRARSLPVRVSP
jgi:hypothetical protein